jgi:hypothetical protein
VHNDQTSQPEALLRYGKSGQATPSIEIGQIARTSSSKAARSRRVTVSSVPSL